MSSSKICNIRVEIENLFFGEEEVYLRACGSEGGNEMVEVEDIGEGDINVGIEF